MQQRLREALVDLGAKPGDVHVDHVGLWVEMIVPNVLEEHRSGYHLAGALHQIFQKPEFARLQHDLLLPSFHGMGEAVELQIGDSINCVFAPAAPPRQHLDAGQQLGKRIGLGQIVVAASAQPFHSVIDLTEGGEDKHRGIDALGAQFTDYREAVLLGQHAINNHDVVLAIQAEGDSLLAVGREVDTGAYESTQTGLFHVYEKAAPLSFDAPYNVYIQWWVGFDRDKANGFHSFLEDKDGKVVDAATGRVSNGCIRSGDAEAIYAYAEVGMPVFVRA